MRSDEVNRLLTLRDRYVNGDEGALSILYYEIFDTLYNYGIRFTRNPEIVKDNIQNLFVDLMSNQKKFSSVINIKYYLLKSLKYLILKEHERKDLEFDELETNNIPFFSQPSIEKKIIHEEEDIKKIRLINMVYGNLGNREREAIYLKYSCGFDYTEISGILNISVESSRTLIYRAIKKIRISFQEKNLLDLLLLLIR